MFQPLAGKRVVETTQVLAGPYCTYLLALMGAEVIKIERPGQGDWTRQGGSDTELAAAGLPLSFVTQNAGKKSITLDLKCARGLAILKQLVEGADVFIENFRPGTAAKLGIAYKDLAPLNERLVYASLSAYGQDGPIGHRPAYDHIIQGMVGIMHTTGTPETAPNKVGSPYVDYATGLMGAFAVLAALMERDRTGKGQQVDVAMLDAAMLLMASLAVSTMATGNSPPPVGNEAFSGSPSSGTYETTEGLLSLASNNESAVPAALPGNPPAASTGGRALLSRQAQGEPGGAAGGVRRHFRHQIGSRVGRHSRQGACAGGARAQDA